MKTIQTKPMFVPFQSGSKAFLETPEQKRFLRSVFGAMAAFLISVTIVSFATNKYEAALREARASATCHASPDQQRSQ